MNNNGGKQCFLKSRKAEFILNFSGLWTHCFSQLIFVKSPYLHVQFFFKACIYLVIKFQVSNTYRDRVINHPCENVAKEGEVREGKSHRMAIYGGWLQSRGLSDSMVYVIMCFTAGALNAHSLCQVSYSHTFWIRHQLNLSCVLYDDQINGLTAAFSINTANWPCSKVLKNHFSSVQNSDKHVLSKTGDNFIILPTLNAFL